MTRTDDLSELKRLAEAAKTQPNQALNSQVTIVWRDYRIAASPSAILSLIARLEAVEARVRELEAHT